MSGRRSGGADAPASRRGVLTAGVLLVIMLGGTLPVPLYVLYKKQMGFGLLGVTVVFAAPGGVVAVGVVAVLRTFGAARAQAVSPAGSWCCPAEEAGRASAQTQPLR